MSDDRYYASVFGGQVCRDCGCVVMDPAAHDDFHHPVLESPREHVLGADCWCNPIVEHVPAPA